MRRPLFKRRVPVILTLVLAFMASDAKAAADLVIYRASITGHNPVIAHDDLQVQFGIRNAGDEESSPFTVTCYLSEDENFTDDDWVISTGEYWRTPPGAVRTGGEWFDVPSDVPNGDYYVGVVLEPHDDSPIATATAGVITVARTTDLRVADVETEAVAHPGEQLYVKVWVYNDGTGVSDSFTVECYIDQYLIGSDTFGPMDPDDDVTCTVDCDIPEEIPDDYYYIRAVVSCPDDEDSGNDEGESDQIWIGAIPDIAVRSVQVAQTSYAPGEKFVVHSLIENIGQRDSESYSVDYYVSTDTAIRTSDHHLGRAQRSGVPAGEEDSYETTFDVPFSLPAGNYYIGAIITCDEEYDQKNNVGRCAETFALVHPPGYVCGQAGYKHRWRSYNVFPIRYALVKIFEHDDDEDPLNDRLIMQTHTDPNGNYAVTMANDPSGNPDIYVKILTEGVSGAYPKTTSKICVLKDEVLDETYSLVSDVHPHPGNASVVINMTSQGDGQFMVFDSVVEGFAKAKTFFGVELSEVSTYWPCEGDSSYFDPCNVGVYISQDDRSDRDVIMHEYGHYVAQVYGVAQGEVGDDPTHYWDEDLRYEPSRRTDEQAMNLAFREAWPTLFSVATQYGDGRYPQSGSSTYDDRDELGDWTFTADLDNVGKPEFSPGQYFGNMNAGALWDIFDDKSNSADGKDTLSDPSLSMIWTISRDYKPKNIVDFWNDWFRKYDFEQEMEYIFETHEMSFPKPE